MKSNIRYKSNINNTSIFLIGTLVLFFFGFFPRPSLLLRRTSYPKKPKASDIIEMVDLPMWVYLSLRFWLDICRIIKDIHILWNHGQKHLNKDERKPLSGLDTNSMSNYHEGKAIYISGSVLFMSLEDSTKLPAMVLAWENFQEVFVMLVVVVVFLPHWRFFIHCLSTSSLTLPWTIAGLLHPFYTFSPAHCRVIHDTFILTFLGFSFLPRVLRFWAGFFYPQAFFTLHSFVCDSDVGRNTQSRIFLRDCPHGVVPSG